MTEANKRQVGGSHYKDMGIEHWDVVALNNLDYFQGQVTKYVMRWRGKNGLQDLEKAKHFLEKYIEVEKLRNEGRLTHAILASIIAKLEALDQEDHRQALSNGKDDNSAVKAAAVTLRALKLPASDPQSARDGAARRVCPECTQVLPKHRDGCSLVTKGAECELCGGLETHTAQCPNQR